MSTCAKLGCSNNQTKSKDKSFFSLPSTPEIKKAWLNGINRKKDNLPHKVVACSNILRTNVLTAHGDYRMNFTTVIDQ